MSVQLILNFMADDRPGLIDDLSQAVAEAGGNWLESRTARLAGKFAGIVLAELPDAARAAALKARLAAMAAAGLHVTASESGAPAEPQGPAITISLVGPDHPGIVREIAHCLATHSASIETMETRIEDAPMGGGVLFHAEIEARLLPGAAGGALRGELERLANALMVDMDLGEVGAG